MSSLAVRVGVGAIAFDEKREKFVIGQRKGAHGEGMSLSLIAILY